MIFQNHTYPTITTLDISCISLSRSIHWLANHYGEGQICDIWDLYQYLKPDVFPSIKELDLSDVHGNQIETNICDLVGKGNPMHYQIIKVNGILYRCPFYSIRGYTL